MTKVCDNRSVGVLIQRGGMWLVFERATPPAGVAPVAGHVDDHGSPEAAAVAEVSEEVGLTVVGLELLLNVTLPNVCRRPGGDHHEWWVYRAGVYGDVAASERETRNPRWVAGRDLQDLADWTVERAHGRMSEAEFEADPGLEPVWCWLLDRLGIVDLEPGDLDPILALAATPPRPR